MARVKIKSENTRDERRKIELLELLATKEIYAVKIIPTTDAYIVITDSEADQDKIFDGVTDKDLERENFSP